MGRFAGVVGDAGADFGVVVGDLYRDAVQAGGDRFAVFAGGRWKLEQIVVVDVVGERVDALVEAVLRAEVGVFAARERGEGVGGVAFQGAGGRHDKAERAGTHLAVEERVENLGFGGLKRDCVDYGVGAAEVGDDFGGLDVGAVIAGFGDEEDGSAIAADGGGLVVVEHVVGVVDGAESVGAG